MMLKIGEFSRLSQVTVKTLHHYDDIGLLKPAEIDQFTGYRYYSVDQLARIHRIMALKDLGLSLDQIAIMLNNHLSNEQIQGMLTLQEAQIQQRLQEEESRLAQVRFRLRMLKMEEAIPDLEVIVKKIDPMRVLNIRKRFANSEGLAALGNEIIDACAKNNISFEGMAPLNILYGNDYRIEDIDIDFPLPVPESHTQDLPLATLGIMTVQTLDAVEAAATYVHRGYPSPVALQENLTILRRWMVANNYRMADEYRFVWYRGPMHDGPPEKTVVEIQHIVETVSEGENI